MTIVAGTRKLMLNQKVFLRKQRVSSDVSSTESDKIVSIIDCEIHYKSWNDFKKV